MKSLDVRWSLLSPREHRRRKWRRSFRLEIEVVAYGRHAGFADPLPRLERLQRHLQMAQIPGRRSHLMPPVGIAVRDPEFLVDDETDFHVALVQDVATQRLGVASESGAARNSAFDDLLTPIVTSRLDSSDRPRWSAAPALNSKPDAAGKSVVDAHRAHQNAVGAHLGLDGPPALTVEMEPDGLQALRVLHELSDWVMTLDRHVGLDLYEDPLSIGLGTNNYILDYAPDFIEGLSHRLTVTTQHRGEVSKILERAMDELGLDAVDESVLPFWTICSPSRVGWCSDFKGGKTSPERPLAWQPSFRTFASAASWTM